MDNNLVVHTIFQRDDIHKLTWKSPHGNTVNQIDNILFNRKWCRFHQDVSMCPQTNKEVILELKCCFSALNEIDRDPDIKKTYVDTFIYMSRNKDVKMSARKNKIDFVEETL